MSYLIVFFFNDTATTEIYTLSLHDALPICCPAARTGDRDLDQEVRHPREVRPEAPGLDNHQQSRPHRGERSEEHTSELQSPCNLVCRLLLEKKKNDIKIINTLV